MRGVALTVVASTLLGQYWATPLTPTGSVCCMLPLVCLTGWFGGTRLLALALGWLWSGLSGVHFVDEMLPEALWLQDIHLHACIVELPRHGVAGSRLRVQVTREAPWGRAPRVQLYSVDPLPALHAGECRRFLVRLKPPHGQVNPGQFDRHLWLYREGVHATGYIRPDSAQPLTHELTFPGGTLLRLRQRWAERLHAWPADPTVAAVLPAIVVGSRQWIDTESWRIFQATGTSHLMAISGLHVGLLAVAGWWFGRRAGLRLVRRGWRIRAAGVASLASIGLALGYALLAGLAIPTLRAALMAVAILVLQTLMRRAPAARSLALVAMTQLVLKPATVLAPGFWLSYGAVLALLMIAARFAAPGSESGQHWHIRLGRKALTAVTTQVLLALALTLPGLLFFGQIAWLSPLINLLAIPWFSFCVLPLSLLGAVLLGLVPWLAWPFLTGACRALEFMLRGLRTAADWPFATALPGEIGALTCILLAAAIGLLLVPQPWRASRAALPALAAAVVLQAWPRPPLHRLVIFDVGQGTAALVVSGPHAVLIDTGPRWRTGDAGEQTLLPALRRLGVEKLDMLIVSHGDADHAGGLASLRAGIRVAQLLGPPDVTASLPGSRTCRRGQHWRIGALYVMVDHPRSHSGWSRNNGSCAVTILVNGQRIWFPGDIEAPAESVVAARVPSIDAVVVVVPHHGSRTSSSAPLLRAVRARYAVVTAGFLNRWGFPAAGVVERWRSSGSCVLNTALTGALTFAPDPSGTLTLTGQAGADWRRPWVVRNPRSLACGAVNAAERGL